MFERFTERARKVMSLARQEAQRKNSETIDTEHIFLAILLEDGGIAAQVLKSFAGSLDRILKKANELFPGSNTPSPLLGQIPFSPRAKETIERAGTYCAKGNVIGTESLLLALLDKPDWPACMTLDAIGIVPQLVKGGLLHYLNQNSQPPSKLQATSGIAIAEGTIVETEADGTTFTILQRNGQKKTVDTEKFGLDPEELKKSIGRRVCLTMQAKFLD